MDQHSLVGADDQPSNHKDRSAGPVQCIGGLVTLAGIAEWSPAGKRERNALCKFNVFQRPRRVDINVAAMHGLITKRTKIGDQTHHLLRHQIMFAHQVR